MREIILDTETTGLSPQDGHRLVEIGAVELFNHLPTGKTFQIYLNPERDMPSEAEAVHGLSSAFLKDKPIFKTKAGEFIEFIEQSVLIIHNASFDMGFINAELKNAGLEMIGNDRVIDTLQMARRKHPMGPNSLDALCRRYGIDNTKRTKHGALMDAELLAEVYLELIGGRQTAMSLQTEVKPKIQLTINKTNQNKIRPNPLANRLTEEQLTLHDRFIAELGAESLWSKPN
jgi:DNA polymerase III subunit epsilon